MLSDKDVVVINLVEQFLTKNDTLVSTRDFLLSLISFLKEDDTDQEVNKKSEDRQVMISCDASIKENPGGPASIGVVIQYDQWKEPMTIARGSKATTNNQAEYDAVYEGLTSFFGLINNPGCPVTIRSDSQLVIKQLKKEIECLDKKLLKRRDTILELVLELPVAIRFEWLPRNSTPELEQANFLAQDVLGVPRH